MGDHMSSRADTLAEMIRDTPSEDLASLIGDLDGAKAKAWALLVSAAIWEKEPRIPNPDRLLKMPEVAHVLGITEHQAREMGRRGELPVIAVGERHVRVRAGALTEWITQRERGTLSRRRR